MQGIEASYPTFKVFFLFVGVFFSRGLPGLICPAMMFNAAFFSLFFDLKPFSNQLQKSYLRSFLLKLTGF